MYKDNEDDTSRIEELSKVEHEQETRRVSMNTSDIRNRLSNDWFINDQMTKNIGIEKTENENFDVDFDCVHFP